MKEWEDRMKLYGIIEQANTIEHAFDSIIAYRYCDDLNRALMFTNEILYNKFFSLSAKKDLLIKMMKNVDPARFPKGSGKVFENWVNTRNIVAHGSMLHTEAGYKVRFAGKSYQVENLVEEYWRCHRTISDLIGTYTELFPPWFGIEPDNDMPPVSTNKAEGENK